MGERLLGRPEYADRARSGEARENLRREMLTSGKFISDNSWKPLLRTSEKPISVRS